MTRDGDQHDVGILEPLGEVMHQSFEGHAFRVRRNAFRKSKTRFTTFSGLRAQKSTNVSRSYDVSGPGKPTTASRSSCGSRVKRASWASTAARPGRGNDWSLGSAATRGGSSVATFCGFIRCEALPSGTSAVTA